MHEFTFWTDPSSFPPSLISREVSTNIIFAFTYMCTHFIVPSLPCYSLSPTPPASHWCHPSFLSRICSTFLFSDFVGEKKEKIKWKAWHFSLR
jgi:hypothetical protein